MTSVRGLMVARQKSIELLTLDQLGPWAAESISAGDRVEVVAIEVPGTDRGGELIDGDIAQAAAELVRRLREERVL